VHGRSDRLRAGRINSVIESIFVEHLRFCSESSGRFNRHPHRELASFDAHPSSPIAVPTSTREYRPTMCL
jgi:hypothetical protein